MVSKSGYIRVKYGYIKIESFMCNDLNLKENMLLVYAIIYEFTVASNGKSFYNSYTYFTNWLSISRQAVTKIVNELIAKGLVVKPYVKNINRVKLYTTKISKEYVDKTTEYRFSKDNLWELKPSFVIIKPYIVNLLKLSKSEMILYAAIENLVLNGNTVHSDNLDYLKSWVSVHEKTFKSIVQKLLESGYITRVMDEEYPTEDLYLYSTIIQSKLLTWDGKESTAPNKT